MSARQNEDVRILRECAARLIKLANNLDTHQSARETDNQGTTSVLQQTWNQRGTASTSKLLERAMSDYRARQRRIRHLPKDLFGEPAWDMLLDLFITALQHRQISVSSACLASGVPSTTALRWLGQLERIGLVERNASPYDQRVVWVKLTNQGLQALTEYYSKSDPANLVGSEPIEEYVISAEKAEPHAHPESEVQPFA